MREIKKRWIFLLACLLLAAALTACASAGGDAPLPESEEAVLTYAALNPVTREHEKLVKWFNANHEGIRMEILDYSDEGGIDRLLVELALGQVPDIMEMHCYGKKGKEWDYDQIPETYEEAEGEYWMPYRQMAQRGYLEDLWPYIENQPKLGREGVLQAPLKAAEADGGLYILFRKTEIFTLMGRESVVGNRNGWTLEELMEAYSGMPEDSTILRYNMTKRNVFTNLLRFSLERYVDRGTGECFFDSQGFRDMVHFLESFPDEVAYEKPREVEEEVAYQIRYGRQMLEGEMIAWPSEMAFADSVWWERTVFPGFPTGDGSPGNFFYPRGTILAMSSGCQNKSAAWDVIYHNLLKPVLNKSTPQDPHAAIPVNLHDYELLIWHVTRAALEHGLKGSASHFRYGPQMPLHHVLTEEDVQRYRDVVDGTTMLYWPEDDLSEIIWESLGAYFAGDRTLDDTIRLLDNRVSLYLHEQQ